MPNSYIISKLADIDISQITKWSLQDFGEKQTVKYMNGLEEILNMLADTPKRGRPFINNNNKKTTFTINILAMLFIIDKERMIFLLPAYFTQKCFLKNIFKPKRRINH